MSLEYYHKMTSNNTNAAYYRCRSRPGRRVLNVSLGHVAAQTQTAVTAFLKSKKWLMFSFSRQRFRKSLYAFWF